MLPEYGQGPTRFQRRRRMLPRTPGAGFGVNTGPVGRPPEAAPFQPDMDPPRTRPMTPAGPAGVGGPLGQDTARLYDANRPKWDAPQTFGGRVIGGPPQDALPMPQLPPWLRPPMGADPVEKLPMPGIGPGIGAAAGMARFQPGPTRRPPMDPYDDTDQKLY